MAYIPTYRASGTTSTGSATAPPTDYPPGLVAGDIIFLPVVIKYPGATVTPPAGFTLFFTYTGGVGVAGDDTGDVILSLYYKISDGTESGSVSFSITGANIAVCRMFAIYDTNYPRVAWDFKAVMKVWSTNSTAVSVTFDSATDVRSDDLLFIIAGFNSDNATYTGYTITITGATVGLKNQRASIGTGGGNDCRLQVITAPVTAGPANDIATYSQTGTVAGPAGPIVLLRVRSRRRRTP